MEGIHIHRKGGKEVTVYFGTEVETALQDYLDERNDVIPEEGSENALFLSLQEEAYECAQCGKSG